MKTSLVRLATIGALTLAAACGSDQAGDAHLKNLKDGMHKAEAIQAMGQGPLTATGADTARLVNGFRRMRFLLGGTQYEVVYARDLPGNVTEPVLQKQETPVVFANDSLIGWGWKYYAETAIPKIGLPTPLRAIDTMSVKPAPPPESGRTGPAMVKDSVVVKDTGAKR